MPQDDYTQPYDLGPQHKDKADQYAEQLLSRIMELEDRLENLGQEDQGETDFDMHPEHFDEADVVAIPDGINKGDILYWDVVVEGEIEKGEWKVLEAPVAEGDYSLRLSNGVLIWDEHEEFVCPTEEEE